ncbi:hypothetical protein ABFS83_09G009600 [Erythranthe nasuta]
MEPPTPPPQILPPPPPTGIPSKNFPIKIERIEKSPPMNFPSSGSKGKRVSLLTNHFKVTVGSNGVGDFFHYDILISYEDGREVTRKNLKMALVDKLSEVYKSELAGKSLVYDGDRSLFALGPLPQNNLEFSIVLNPVLAKCVGGNEQKRQRLSSTSKMFKLQLKFTSRISMQRRLIDCSSLRVLNAILRQQALRQGCLALHQSFFLNDTKNLIDLGGGIHGCRGFFSSFKALQGGMYLNHDVCMTTIVQSGSVVDFLIRNQNVKTPFEIDWNKARGTLKNLRFKVNHLKFEFKITGFSDRPCKEQKFSLKLGEANVETMVYDYFVKTRGIKLSFSANLPCINAGKPRKPKFFPIELCSLVPLQRYKNELTGYQTSAMIKKSSQKPEELLQFLDDTGKMIKHEAEPLLTSCGISIDGSFVQAEGRVLSAPRLIMGNGEHIFPRNGFWNIKNKKFLAPKKLENWAVVNFSTSCDIRSTCLKLAKVSSNYGMVVSPPACVIQENSKYKKKPGSVRVEVMFQQIKSRFQQNPPRFILCLLSDKKFCDLYGPWKKKTIVEFGILDQCVSSNKIDEKYLMNLMLKINAKLGGFNHTILSELTRSIPFVSKVPTMILGMEVSHASPGPTERPSIASVVGSREWPRISSYRACLRALPPKVKMIDSLFKPISEQKDAGIINELLLEFFASSGNKKPAQIIIFRNGLSTTEYKQIVKEEMDQILKACNFLEEKWRPKFTVIVSQRRHHTKFFDKSNSGANVSPGTIVDNKVCDLQCNNFYMNAHAARIGTPRPTHYHVLLDEIGFSSDDLQEVIHSLSYVFQRSNNAISEVAPVRYARLAAAKISQVIKAEKTKNASCNGQGGQLPKLHKNVSSSMFFI